MNRDEFTAQVADYLRKVNAEADDTEFPVEVGLDDNLFDLGLVTSFSVIRMIVFIEDLAGCTIELGEHELEVFYTLRGLYSLIDEKGASV